MKPYADTNFYTRLYLPLADSPRADKVLQDACSRGAEVLPVTWLHHVELANAFQWHVFFGKQPGNIRVTPEQAAIAWESFRLDLSQAGFVARKAVSEADLERQAEDLALRHTARYGFRTYDLLHVSAALLLECDAFWSFDAKCSELARREGLEIF